MLQLWISRNGGKYDAPWVRDATTWTPPANGLPGGNYRWWVRGWGPEIGYGAWSSPEATFSIVANTPSAITPIAPTGAGKRTPMRRGIGCGSAVTALEPGATAGSICSVRAKRRSIPARRIRDRQSRF